MFKRGANYTRRDIHDAIGGGLVEYLPHRGGIVVAGCFTPRLDPHAPDVILVGDGPNIQRWAEVIARQPSPVPCFLKRATNAWEYVGRYQSTRFTHDAAEIARESAGTGRTDVTGVLYLSPGSEFL